MEHTITIGQLRQNPTEMIRAVQDGAAYTLTDRGRPIATITPHRPGTWRSGAAVNEILDRLGPDPAWAAELEELRVDAVATDPWAEPA